MSECEHQVLEKSGFEAYVCKECGLELTTSSIGVMKMFASINKKSSAIFDILEILVNREGEKHIDGGGIDYTTDDPSKIQTTHELTDSKPSEEVIMDLKEVTVIVITPKAVLLTKKGYQKWVPLSQIHDDQDAKEGDYIEELKLTEKGEGWIHKKGWDKLEVRKR